MNRSLRRLAARAGAAVLVTTPLVGLLSGTAGAFSACLPPSCGIFINPINLVTNVTPVPNDPVGTRTWTGAAPGLQVFPGITLPDTNWSTVANWDGTAPGIGDTVSFPALSGGFNRSFNNFSGLSVAGMTLDAASGASPATYSISGNQLTLGSGGLTSTQAPQTTFTPAGTNSIALSIALGAAQTWSIAGSGPSLTGAVTGTAPLTVDLTAVQNGTVPGSATPELQTGQVSIGTDVEVGDLAITGTNPANTGGATFGNGFVMMNPPFMAGDPTPALNATDGNGVSITDAGLNATGQIGPLTTTGAALTIGGLPGLINFGAAGSKSVQVEGDATLDPTTLVNFNNITGTTAGTDYPQLSATGNIDLNGAQLALNTGCNTLQPSDVLTLVQAGAGKTVSGQFTLPGGQLVPDGAVVSAPGSFGLTCLTPSTQDFVINYTAPAATSPNVAAHTAPAPTEVTATPTNLKPTTIQVITDGSNVMAMVNPTDFADGGNPTGSVTVNTGSTPVCTVTLSPNAGAGSSGSCTATNAPQGTNPITATYSGDSTFGLSATTGSLTVSAPAPAPPVVFLPPVTAPAPPPPGASGNLPPVTSTVSSTNSPTTVSGKSGTSSATVTVPAGALPTGTSVSLYPVTPPPPPPGVQGFVLGFGVSWTGQTNTNANTPVTMTVTDPNIAAGDVVYELDSTGKAVPLPPGSYTVDPVNHTVTLTFTQDPSFLVALPTPAPTVVATAGPRPSVVAPGYRLVGSDGGVFDFGSAVFQGSLAGKHLNAPIVATASTPGGGYWLAGSDGSVYAFGNAANLGSLAGRHLNAPIVAMAATPDGKGYWLLGADGGVFSFGDAVFHGSTGGKRLNGSVVGMAATPDGNGYWLLGSDGGVFSFGDAAFHGSTGGRRLNSRVVSITATRDGAGYWLVAGDGGVFSFGDAAFHGSIASLRPPVHPAPIVGAVQTADGQGYWLVGSDGGVFAFGDAAFEGAATSARPMAPIAGAVGS